METKSAHGVLVELDSLETLDLIVGAEKQCRDAFPQLSKELDLSEIAVETWQTAIPELRQLFPLHWKEIALYQNEIEMDIDEGHYQRCEDAGILCLLTARVERKLVGYYIAYISSNPHYKSSGPWATTDMYFILPEYRTGTGLKLFVAFEKIARAKGATHGATSCKVHQDHSEMLTKLGWEWTDKTFQKHLCDSSVSSPSGFGSAQ
jgi:hypothetical protein